MFPHAVLMRRMKYSKKEGSSTGAPVRARTNFSQLDIRSACFGPEFHRQLRNPVWRVGHVHGEVCLAT